MLMSLHTGPSACKRMYNDVREAYGQRGRVDLYVSGFPCQPFSSVGLGLGSLDPRNAADAVLDYIIDNKPKVVVLENVKGIAERHKPVFAKVQRMLQKASDQVTWTHHAHAPPRHPS